MKSWRKHPAIYEINALVWLGELSRTHKRPVTLSTVSDEEWGVLAVHGFHWVWLMGVWKRSPVGMEISM